MMQAKAAPHLGHMIMGSQKLFALLKFDPLGAHIGASRPPGWKMTSNHNE
jgi:hypothetical protein